MPQPGSSSCENNTATVDKPEPRPFLLTAHQGEAARALLSYVASLPLSGPDPQLLAVVVAIRAARGGIGNVTGADLSALRLDDPGEAVDALRRLGWQVDDGVFDHAPGAPPVAITVPDLAQKADHPLPFGEHMRSRVSGWSSRTLSAKPVKKLPSAARLAALFAAAHSTSGVLGQIPSHLPEACRAALPTLLDKGFLAELTAETFRLNDQVRHLSGMRLPTDEPKAATATRRFEFDADAWAQWKDVATPALRRHVESVEYCALCALAPERVAEAFMRGPRARLFSKKAEAAYDRWRAAHPDCGVQAARFCVAFRAEHGHGPSFRQLGNGLGRHQKRSVLGLIVTSLLSQEWLTSTNQVPWTLRPGQAAQEQGITLPGARGSAPATAPTQP